MRHVIAFFSASASINVLAAKGALDGPELAARKAAEERQAKLRDEAAALEASAIPNLHATWRSVMPAVLSEVAAMGGRAPGFSRQEARFQLRQIARATASMSRRAGRREAITARKSRRAQKAVQAHAAKAV